MVPKVRGSLFRRSLFRSPLGGVLGAALCLAAIPGSRAAAATALIDWPTYLRTGPGEQFVVLQELARGDELEVLGCTGKWCQVRVGRVVGFVDQPNLAQLQTQPAPQPQPAAQATPAANPAACFDARRDGYGKKGDDVRYCPD